VIPAKQLVLLLAVLAVGSVFASFLLSGGWLWLLILAGIVLLFWALASPYRCLLLVLFTYPLERIGTIRTPWFNIKPFQLLALFTLFALLLARARKRAPSGRAFPREPILAWYLAFLVANAVAFGISGNLDDMRAIFHYLMFALIALLLVLLVRTPQQFAGTVRVLAFSGAIAGLFGVLQYFGYLSGLDTAVQETRMFYVTGESAALRVTSLYYDPNLFASFLCLALPLGLACTQADTHAIERGLAGAGVVVMLVSLAFTQSRSGFFGVAAGTATFLMVQRRLAALGRAFLAAALLAALGWTALSLYGSDWYSPEIFLNRALAMQQGVTDRRMAWHQILEAFKDNPVFGVGPAQATNWAVYIPNMRSNWDISNSRIVAHNIFVDVAVGSGLVGLVPFAFMVGLLIWRAWQNVRSAALGFTVWDAAVFAALVSVLINSQSITTLIYPFLWTLAGLVVARSELHRAPRRLPQPTATPARPSRTLAEVRP
jgi:putative inorganic carbon (HCO3(-)) transporter